MVGILRPRALRRQGHRHQGAVRRRIRRVPVNRPGCSTSAANDGHFPARLQAGAAAVVEWIPTISSSIGSIATCGERVSGVCSRSCSICPTRHRLSVGGRGSARVRRASPTGSRAVPGGRPPPGAHQHRPARRDRRLPRRPRRPLVSRVPHPRRPDGFRMLAASAWGGSTPSNRENWERALRSRFTVLTTETLPAVPDPLPLRTGYVAGCSVTSSPSRLTSNNSTSLWPVM